MPLGMMFIVPTTLSVLATFIGRLMIGVGAVTVSRDDLEPPAFVVWC